MITEFGGAVAVPSAVRSSDSTTTIRVNDVIMIRIDGAIDSTVNSAISWIARSVTPPLPWPRLMLMSCANAGSASDPAASEWQKIKLYAGRSPISRRGLWTAQQGRHLVFEILKAALRRRREAGTGGAIEARCAAGDGSAAARAPPAAHRSRGSSRLAGRPAQRGFQPLRHLGEILVRGRQ